MQPMITESLPATVAAMLAEAPAWMIGALPPTMDATMRVLPPTRMSSISRLSAAKYPASLAIHAAPKVPLRLG